MTAPTAPESRIYRASGIELETNAAGRLEWLHGMACPYGVPTDIGFYTEILEIGCFKKSCNEAAKALPLLLFHNASSLDHIIGQASEWDHRDDGLWGIWRLGDSSHAQRAAHMAQDGDLGFMSVGFQGNPARDGYEYHDDGSVTITRRECRLLEVSLTPTPAYKDAQVSKVRTAAPERKVYPHRSEWARILDELSS